MLRAFLAMSAVLWVAYGVLCFLNPELLLAAAGVSAESPTGTIELRATYGGLQAALGVLAAAALVQPRLQRPALVSFAFVCAGLFMARLLGALVSLEVSAYTAVGLLFEILWTVFAVRLLARLPRGEEA